jgi:hypothetical protein
MDKESATSELGTLKANVSELHFVVEQQNSALQAKQEELSLQRERLLKIQSEAEVNERRVRELDVKLRMSEDANKVRVLPFSFSHPSHQRRRRDSHSSCAAAVATDQWVLPRRPYSCRSARIIQVWSSLLWRRKSFGPR